MHRSSGWPTRRPGTGVARRPGRFFSLTFGLVLILVLAVAGVFALLQFGLKGGFRGIQPRCTAQSEAGTAHLEPNQAANAALIAAVASSMGLSPRAVTIGLATAMQESKLRNIDYGDRDSLGLFQQRPSQGWGTPDQVQDPIYAAKRFFQALAELPDFEAMSITEAAQAVQRSAYPEAYAQHEAAARSFASSLTGHSPAGLACQFHPVDNHLGLGDELAATHLTEWGMANAVVQQNQVVISAADATAAWAEAAWAVAKGGAFAIESVQVNDQIWRRDQAAWQPLDSPKPPAGQVIITMASFS